MEILMNMQNCVLGQFTFLELTSLKLVKSASCLKNIYAAITGRQIYTQVFFKLNKWF